MTGLRVANDDSSLVTVEPLQSGHETASCSPRTSSSNVPEQPAHRYS